MKVVPKTYFLKLTVFVEQWLALHQNGVEFLQKYIGDTDISIILATSHDVAQCSTESFLYTPSHKAMLGGRYTA